MAKGSRRGRLPFRRVVASVIWGVLTTVGVAWVGPLAWSAVFHPMWQPGPLLHSAPFGILTSQTRPFVDVYTVSPGAYRDAIVRTQDAPWSRPPAAVVTDADREKYTRVDTALCGWPMRAMASEAWVQRAAVPVEFRWHIHIRDTIEGPMLIPLRPVWPGFAVNAAAYSAAWLAVLCVPMVQVRWWLGGWRLRRGRCPACGYDLR